MINLNIREMIQALPEDILIMVYSAYFHEVSKYANFLMQGSYLNSILQSYYSTNQVYKGVLILKMAEFF
jgi:uncharacterized membrane protein YbaN (DUF454 family)